MRFESLSKQFPAVVFYTVDVIKMHDIMREAGVNDVRVAHLVEMSPEV
jgi:hypothetical protein